MAYVFYNNSGLAGNGTASFTVSLPGGFAAGYLGLIFTACDTDGQTISTPTGWTLLSPDSQTTFCKLYGRYMQLGDVGPALSWSGGKCVADVGMWSGDVYSDMSTIVDVSADRATTNVSLVNYQIVNRTPTGDGRLCIAAGRKQKQTGGLNTFGNVSSGGFSIISQLSSNGPGQASVWNSVIQTTATLVGSISSTFGAADSTARSEGGFFVALQPSVPGLPVGDNESPMPVAAARRSGELNAFVQVPIELRSIPAPALPPQALDTYMPRAPAFPAALRGSDLNLVESTLKGKDQVLVPVDWEYAWDGPLDRLPAYLIAESYPLGPVELTALTTYPPYLEFNWTVPPGPRQWSRSFEQYYPLVLIGKDKVFGAPGQGVLNVQYDNPQARPFPRFILAFESNGLALLATPPQFPPASLGRMLAQDLPPRRPKAFFNDIMQGTPLAILAKLTVYPPFAPSVDLPPRGPVQPIANRGYEFSVLANLFGRDILPPGRGDQSIPTRPLRLSASLLDISENYPFLIPTTPPVNGTGVIHMGRVVLDPARVGEIVQVPFDFTSGLQAGEVLLAASTTAAVYSGTDSSPSSIISGAAAVSGSIALQTCRPTIVGVIYALECSAVTSAGQLLKLAAYFAVEPQLP